MVISATKYVVNVVGQQGINMGFPGGASGKQPTCQCRRHNAGSVPGLGRFPGGGRGNPLQYSCLENLMGRADWIYQMILKYSMIFFPFGKGERKYWP